MTHLAADRPTRLALRHRWRGPWLLAVAALHTVFAVVAYPEPLRDIVQRGVFHSVEHDPVRGAVVWFVLFGAVFALLGWAVLQLERQGPGGAAALRVLGWGLLLLALLGIVLMPASGFWLVLPPALAMCLARRAAPSTPAGPSSRKNAA